MKFLQLPFLALTILIVSSCEDPNIEHYNELVVGTWRNEAAGSEGKLSYDADGTYLFDYGPEDRKTGTWRMNQSILYTKETGKEDEIEQEISQLNENRMVIHLHLFQTTYEASYTKIKN